MGEKPSSGCAARRSSRSKTLRQRKTCRGKGGRQIREQLERKSIFGFKVWGGRRQAVPLHFFGLKILETLSANGIERGASALVKVRFFQRQDCSVNHSPSLEKTHRSSSR